VDQVTRSGRTATTPSGDSTGGRATEAESRAKLIDMNRTRLVAIAVLVPVVAAVVAAVLITAVTGATALSVTQVSAGPSMGGFRQDGGNRGW
jgi:hypothetical protein